MTEIDTNSDNSDSWTEHELLVLKTLVALNTQMDIICNELGRSWTASALKAIDLGLHSGLRLRDRQMVRLRRVEEIQN